MNPILSFMPGGNDACALYRMFMPHVNIPNSRFLYNEGNLPLHDIADSDLLLVQRLVSNRNYEALQMFEEMNLHVAYDLDDNLWEVPNYNPAAKMLRQVQSGFGTCAAKCSIIVTSTENLKASVKRHIGKLLKGKQIVSIPNAIDLNLFRPLPKRDSQYVNVGWFGTNTHSGDVAAVFGMLPEMLEKLPNMRLLIAGLQVPDNMSNHPRVRQLDFVPVAQYASRLASWRCDILLVPLLDNPFNRSKSNIKLLEAGALHMAALASPVGPYKEFCRHDPDLDWCLCHTAQQWKNKLTELVNDAGRREHIADVMYSVVQKKYNIEDVRHKWVELVKWLR